MDRSHKIQARKRGADLRNVSVTPLKISANGDDSQSPLPKMLQSALIHSDDINLPRFRRSTVHSTDQSTNDVFVDSVDQLSEEEINSVDSDQESQTAPDLGPSSPRESSRERSRGSSRGSSRETSPDRSRESSPESPKKRPKGRPKKIKIEEASQPLRKSRGRPKRSSQQPELGLTPEQLETMMSAPRRARKTTKSPSTSKDSDSNLNKSTPFQPISLTQLKANGAHRPLEINVETLNTPGKDKRHKINTLDVLKHLIGVFKPEPVDIPEINTSIVQSEFKTHLLDHIKHLTDVHGTIDDLSHQISMIQKQKEEIRRGIFELRSDHAKVGNDLNKLRASYQESTETYNKQNSLFSTIEEIKQGMNKDSAPEHADMIRTIDRQIPTLGKLFHPDIGLGSRLKAINDILERVNDNN